MDLVTSDDHRIPVVDRERIHRLLLSRGAETQGFRADAAADRKEAARMLREPLACRGTGTP